MFVTPSAGLTSVGPVTLRQRGLGERGADRDRPDAVRRGADHPHSIEGDARDHADTVSARIPARRVGVDEDMAAAAIYLASRAGDYVVGTTLTVDGGVNLVR